MYITHTISEDRTGTADEVMSKRLAALTADRHRSRKNEKKKPPRRNAWGVEESESSADNTNGTKGPDKDPDRVLIELQDIEDAITDIQADLDALETVQDRPTAFSDPDSSPRQKEVERLSIATFVKWEQLDERICRLKSDLDGSSPRDAPQSSIIDRLFRLIENLKVRRSVLLAARKAPSQHNVKTSGLVKGSKEKRQEADRSWQHGGYFEDLLAML
jgi:hypothetical protein